MSQWIHASPKDHGYSWVILIGCHLVNLIVPGIIWKSFGILFIPIQEHFLATATQLYFISSLLIGLGFLLGPVANILVNRYNTRTVALLSGFLLLTGFVCSAHASSLPVLYVTFGVFIGIGSGLIYSPAIILVGEYFTEKTALANGIAFAGTGIGGICFPVLIRYFLSEYGLNGTLLILGGLTFNVCVTGMLFRPHIFYKPRYLHNMKMNRNKIEKDTNAYHYNAAYIESEGETKGSQIIERVEPCQHKEIQTMPNKSSAAFEWYLLKYPTLILYGITGGLSIVCYSGLMTMTAPHAVEIGFTPTTASLVISSLGVSDIISRLMAGVLVNRGVVTSVHLYGWSLAVNGFTTAAVAWLGRMHLAGLVFASNVSAACAGCYISLLPMVLADALGVRRVRSGFALVTMACGLFNLSVPYCFGALKDITGTWDASLYLCAAISCAIALMQGALPLARKYADRMDEDRKRDLKVDDDIH